MEKITNPFKDHYVPDHWLEGDDRQMLRESLTYFDDVDGGHSFFQITNFILSDKDFPTPAAKFYQARLEMFQRYTNVVNGYNECRIVEAEAEVLNAELLDLETQSTTNVSRPQMMKRLAQVKLLTAQREQKLTRAAFIKKDASRQLRELRGFWQNHQHYAPMLKAGVTRELAEPEKWLALANQKMTWYERIRALVTGHTPRSVELTQFLQGPMIQARTEITRQFLDPQRERVLQLEHGKGGSNGA